MKHFNEKGRSTLEMLCVLAIMGILSVIAINGYQYMMSKYKANKEVYLVQEMMSIIQQTYMQQENYEGLSNDTLNALKVIPSDFGTNSKTSAADLKKLESPYGGFFHVFASNPEAENGTQWNPEDAYTTAVIEIGEISQQTCLFLATTNWGVGLKEGVVGVATANTTGNLNDGENPVYTAGKLVDIAYANTTPTTGENKLGAMNGKALAIANVPTKKEGYRLPMRPALAAEGCSCVDAESNLDTQKCSFAIKFY